MLNKESQLSLNFSNYKDLYDILITKDNILRQMNEMINFSFIYDELKNNYSEIMGRPSENPIRMFKYLILKTISKLSDRDLVEKVKVDMSYKYFLGYNPEDIELIDSSSLTVFRRQRLKDTNMLDLLIGKTVEVAIEKELIEVKNKLILDSTHTNARYQHISPREALIKQSKLLRKTIYQFDESMKEKMPKKKEATGLLDDQMEYTKELITTLEKEDKLLSIPAISEQKNLLEEMLNDTKYELEYSQDRDAKIGHKTADTSFFGYKTHIAMTPERIVTAATITSGEKHDGKELKSLVEKSKKTGIEVEAVIGDGAYSESNNIKYCEMEEIKLASKLSKSVTHGIGKNKSNFSYNKDADMYVCKSGHMAIKKVKSGSKKRNEEVLLYHFDVEKCKHCLFKEGCYKKGSRTKTYSVKIKNNTHIKHMDYMKTEEFQDLYKERYKIEAKNSEIKNVYGYDTANSCGLLGMSIQGATTLFLANIKRIITLETEKIKKVKDNI